MAHYRLIACDVFHMEVERLVSGQMRLQDKRLEKPAHMRQMPPGRADVGHRLDDVVFCFERLAEPLGTQSHRAIAFSQRLGRSHRRREDRH